MKTISIPLYLIFLLCLNVNAQFYEWAKKVENIAFKGSGCLDIAIDKDNNYYLLNYNRQLGSVPVYSFEIKKYASNGTVLADYNSPAFYLSYGGYSIAIDSNKNIIVAGFNQGYMGLGDVKFGKDTVHIGNNFIIKFDNSFKIKWVKQFTGFGPLDIVTDKNCNIYYTDGGNVTKRNTSGNIAWTNLNYGGNSISVDQNNKIYVFTYNLVTKLNNISGNLIWSKPSHNANYMAVRNNGEIFISNSDSLIKLDNNGNFVWNRKASGIIGITVDNLGRAIYIKDSLVERVSNNGTKKQWSLNTEGGQFSIIGLDRNDNVILGGTTKDQVKKAILCPFEILRYCPVNNNFYNSLFLTKLNVNNVVPFQAGIFTDAGSYLNTAFCVKTNYKINYTFCTNSNSNFGVGNEFRAQLSDSGGTFNNPIDCGKPDSIFIPGYVKQGYYYKMRVVSTNPTVYGYPNIPDEIMNCYEFVRIFSNNSMLIADGPTTFCNGNNVKLTSTNPNWQICEYNWFKNDTLIPNWNYDTLTITKSGKYKVLENQSGCGCVDTTNEITVTINPNPAATITPLGPTSFCNGDSVLLMANAGIGFHYQWKANGVGIPFAIYQVYTAKQAAQYKVKITDANGCTTTSAGLVVNVPCRTGESASRENISIMPNPNDGIFQILSQNNIQSIEIFTMTGQLIYKNETLEMAKQLDINSKLSPNVYLVKIVSENNTDYRKLIVE